MLALIAAAAFVIAAFAAAGNQLFGWPALTWLAIGLAAWALHGAYAYPAPRALKR
jgi:hypothetical protein